MVLYSFPSFFLSLYQSLRSRPRVTLQTRSLSQQWSRTPIARANLLCLFFFFFFPSVCYFFIVTFVFPLGDTIDFISQVSKVRRCTTTFYRHLRSPENPPPKKNKKKWRLFGSPVRRRSIETADAVWSSKATNWFNYGVSPFAGRTQRKTSNQKKTRIFFYLWSFLALVDARKNRQTPVSLHDRHRACACWLADFIYRNPKFLISPHGTCCPLCFAFLFVSVGEMKAIVTSFSFPFSFSLGKSFTKPFFSSFFFLGALRFSFFFSLFSYTLHFTNSWPRWFKVLPFYLTFFFLLPVFALLFLASSWLRIFISLCDRSAHVPRQFLGIQNRTTSTQVGPWYLFYFRSEDDTCLCLSVHPSVRSQTPCPSHAPI